METMWFVAFLIQYGALVAGFLFVSALVVSVVYELVKNKVSESIVFGSTSVQQPAEGSAS